MANCPHGRPSGVSCDWCKGETSNYAPPSKYREKHRFLFRPGMKACPSCNSRGTIMRGFDGKKIQCTTCHGTGQVGA
jgi:DnaJ-class molecular chaperone